MEQALQYGFCAQGVIPISNMNKYSFIIPHKNIPSLLQRCLDSIPNRPNIEIIVVDDNSDDESIKKIHTIYRKDLRIIYTTENKGAGYARNIGLKNATGEWIIFADADDIFEPDFNKILDIISNDTLSEIINFEVTSRNSETNQPSKNIDITNYHCSEEKYLKNPISFKYVMQVPWGKAIRRTFIQKRNILFEETKYGNDVRFATLCDFYCQYRQIIPITGYCWMYREGSLWQQKNLEWAETRFYVLIKTGKLMRKLGDFEYAEKLIDSSNIFFAEIKKNSYIKFLKALFFYIIANRKFRTLFINIPYMFLQDFKQLKKSTQNKA